MRDRTESRAASSIAKLLGFGLILLVVGGLAAVAGDALEPKRIGGEEATDGHGAADAAGHADAGGGEHGEEHGSDAEAATGLAIAEHGYRLDLETPELTAGRAGELRFSIRDENGAAVEEFDLEHGRRMHLIVVRRDLSGFQHLHPELVDGTWRVPLTLEDPGPYRVYADFSAAGESLTLGADLTAAGPYEPAGLPEPSDVDATAGYEVRKTTDGHGAIEFRVSRDGAPVKDLQPYLGARGHLVVIREGDLAYLHVHPEEEGGPAEIGFHAELPTPGRYRMYLQFRHEGVVRTVEFTEEVER